jgi:hypothetical protein
LDIRIGTWSAVFDVNDDRSPRTEATFAEPGAFTFDVGRSAVTQLDRHFGKRKLLEMPAPSRVHLCTRYDATDRDPRRTPRWAAWAAATCAALVSDTRNVSSWTANVTIALEDGAVGESFPHALSRNPAPTEHATNRALNRFTVRLQSRGVV